MVREFCLRGMVPVGPNTWFSCLMNLLKLNFFDPSCKLLSFSPLLSHHLFGLFYLSLSNIWVIPFVRAHSLCVMLLVPGSCLLPDRASAQSHRLQSQSCLLIEYLSWPWTHYFVLLGINFLINSSGLLNIYSTFRTSFLGTWKEQQNRNKWSCALGMD